MEDQNLIFTQKDLNTIAKAIREDSVSGEFTNKFSGGKPTIVHWRLEATKFYL